jgi:hypothetical protein
VRKSEVKNRALHINDGTFTTWRYVECIGGASLMINGARSIFLAKMIQLTEIRQIMMLEPSEEGNLQ